MGLNSTSGLTEKITSLDFQQNGVDLGDVSTVNFTGASVDATNSNGTLTVNISAAGGGGSGSVTSVAVSGGDGITVAGSPVTTSGTITIDISGLPTSKIAGGSFGRAFFATPTTAAAQSLLNQTNGTVTQVFVASANGFKGSVSNPTSQPVITIDASAIPTSKITGGTFGRNWFAVGTTAAAHSQLAAGTVGLQVYQAATTAAAQGSLNNWENLTILSSALRVLDSDQSHFLLVQFAHALTTNRTFTINTGSTDKSLVMSGNITVGGNFVTSGATTITTYGATIVGAVTTAAAQGSLGGGTVGVSLFAAATTAAAQNTLGGTTVGKALFESVDATAARTTLSVVASVTAAVSGANVILNMVSLTSGQYESITPDAKTLYFIT